VVAVLLKVIIKELLISQGGITATVLKRKRCLCLLKTVRCFAA